MSRRESADASKDYYTMLGVLASAEDVVIKGAYRALAQRYHPDRFEGDAEEANRHMANINEAYLVLSNPELRQAYDQMRLGSGTEVSIANVAATSEINGIEAEQYRPFAEKLGEWGYDEQAINSALIDRGVPINIAGMLAMRVTQMRRQKSG